jgi:hypothetical protein
MTVMMKSLAACGLVLLAQISAADSPSWDGAGGSGVAGMAAADQAPAPATPSFSSSGACVPKRMRPKVKEAAAAAAPEIVDDAAAFALAPEEIAEAAKSVPAADSPLGIKLAAIVNRAYVGGEATGSIDAASLRVISWNLNAPKTRKAIDGLLAAFTNSPKGVQDALGRKKPLDKKAVAQLPEVAENDVFLIQEIPLPTAVELADAIGAQVYWVPEFIEVGDNAKGMDPKAGWDFTGNAIMSRIPLSDFRVLRFNNQADWYYAQKADQPLGDKLEKLAAKTLFAVDYGNPHQTRPPLPYGGRAALFARADASGKPVWVGDLHLEDLAGATLDGPQLRCVQMEEALASIKTLNGPVVFGGDLNTMGLSVGVGEGEDLSTEGTNLTPKNVGQAPIDRQHGLAAGVGNKFFGVVDAGNLITTLSHDPGSRKMLVVQQSASLAIDIVPYAPTVHDGVNAIRKMKKDPAPGKIAFYGAEVAADFFPYTAAAANGFKVYRDEKARHDPSSRFNADHTLFRGVKKETGAVPLNPRTGFRFGMGGYQSTWSSGRPMGLVDTAVDWMFLVDADHQLQPTKSEVLKNVVKGSKTGSRPDDRLSDHYPLRVQLALGDVNDAAPAK